MRILVDTNVIISGLIAKGACFEILEDVVYSHTPLITPYILAECREVLLSKFHLSRTTVKSLLHVVERHFKRGTASTKPLNVCRDPDDNQILADALINKAELILSGDKDLLSMEEYEGIRIIGPKDYWKI
jgi:putative PIN family toxin of toxin-antitoxin system